MAVPGSQYWDWDPGYWEPSIPSDLYFREGISERLGGARSVATASVDLAPESLGRLSPGDAVKIGTKVLRVLAAAGAAITLSAEIAKTITHSKTRADKVKEKVPKLVAIAKDMSGIMDLDPWCQHGFMELLVGFVSDKKWTAFNGTVVISGGTPVDGTWRLAADVHNPDAKAFGNIPNLLLDAGNRFSVDSYAFWNAFFSVESSVTPRSVFKPLRGKLPRIFSVAASGTAIYPNGVTLNRQTLKTLSGTCVPVALTELSYSCLTARSLVCTH